MAQACGTAAVTGRYGTRDAAFRRAEVLRQKGTWPGVITHADGSASLTYDPQDTITAEGE